MILVSATPYCLVTLDSRLPERLQSKSTEVDDKPSLTILVKTKPDGKREFHEQKLTGGYKLLDAEPSIEGLTDVHILSWKDVVSGGLEGGAHRCAS